MKKEGGIASKLFAGALIAVLGVCVLSAVFCLTSRAATMWSNTYGGIGEEFGAGAVIQTSDGGYVLAGETNSSGAGKADFWLVKADSAGLMLWNRTYGGADDEKCTDMFQINGGGYIVAGITQSFGAGDADAWLVKTDNNGNTLWNKTYGGADDEKCTDMFQTGGGYIVAGLTQSFGAGDADAWLVKTDNNGNTLWNKTYGGAGNDKAFAAVQTGDGGYALAGNTSSYGAGMDDFWLVKTDAAGTMQWNKTYGGAGKDYAEELVQTNDGGYAIAGVTNSFGAGNYDFWLVRTDSAGNMVWNKTYGGTGSDYGYSLVATSDGGYAMAGYTTSGGIKAYLVKTDASGTMLWNKTYGGSYVAIGLVQTGDGGYAIDGISYTNGQDFFLVKTDAAGNLQWEKTFGGTRVENAFCLIQTSDGGYALMGQTNSFGAGLDDIWLVKTDEAGVVPEFSSWFVLSVVLVATGFIVFGKKTMMRRLYT